MKILPLAIATLAVMSSISIAEARHAYDASSVITGRSVANGDADSRDWFTTLVQEDEGYPKPASPGRCLLVRQQVTDLHGRFLGFHVFTVC